MKLRWTTPAVDELEAAQTYYHDLNPQAAHLLAQRIVHAAKGLRDHPNIGRPGLRENTREWVVSRTPYILIYRQTAGAVEILHVWDSRTDWQNLALD